MPVNRYILNDKPTLTIQEVNALNLQPENLVREEVAAVIIDKHRVTLRVWRRTGRGPAYIKDLAGGISGDVRYRYGDLMAWLESNRVDPSALTGDAEILYRNCMGSDRTRVQYEAGEVPCGDDVFEKVPL